MSSDTLSSIVEQFVETGMRDALPRLVEAIAKHLKNGKSNDEIVEAISEQKLSSSSKPKTRSTSESRKTSSRGASRAPASSSKSKTDKRQWISFDQYKSEFEDADVCTYIPSRGDNGITSANPKLCGVDVKDPDTSDKSRVRCGAHKKLDPDGSSQRFNKNVKSKAGSRGDDDDEPEVTERHRPPVSTSSRAVRSTPGVPRAVVRGSRQATPESEASDRDGEEAKHSPRRGLTTSSIRPSIRPTATPSSRVSSKTADTPTTATPTGRRNPLATRMTARSEPKPDPEPSDRDEHFDEVPASRRGRSSRTETQDEESAEKPIRRVSVKDREESPKKTPARSSRREKSAPKDEEEAVASPKTTRREGARSTPHETTPPKRSTRVHREATPDPEPDAADAASEHAEPAATSDFKSFTVSNANAAGVEFIKFGDTRFLAIDTNNNKALGVYPFEVIDGGKIPPVWKTKLNTNYTDAELDLIKQLTSDDQ